MLMSRLGRRRPGEALGTRARELLGHGGRLLEIGCGRGEILAGAARVGWTARGVEMTGSYSESARSIGFEIETSPVETCRSLGEKWHVVLLAAVLEHLYEPRQCLARIYSSLFEGGLVFIDVPNECSLWTRCANAYMRVRGRAWAVNLSPTFPPYHVVGFCPRSLHWLATDLGYEVLEIKTHRWRNELPPRASVLGRIERLGTDAALSLGAWIGSGAGMTAWIRKPKAL